MSKPIQAAITNNGTKDQGFALPLVIVVGLFLMVSGFGLLAQTFGAFRGSIKNNQQLQAQELAERGVTEILDQLNTDHRYLWVNCHNSTSGSCGQSNIGGWNNGGTTPQFSGATCLGNGRTQANYTDTINLEGEVTPANTNNKQEIRGRWSLVSYTFQGNTWTGGIGTIRVRGERKNVAGDTMASAIIDHQVQVRAKPCNQTVTTASQGATFPGLLGESINLGNNDVLGYPGANVYCTNCTKPSQAGRLSGSYIDGELVAGDINLPPVPTFPASLNDKVSEGSITSNLTIQPPNEVNTTFNNAMCATDQDKVAHCKVSRINLSGSETLTIDTTKSNQPVRIYLRGNLKLSGNSQIVHTKEDSSSTDLSIFGPTKSCKSQSILMNGGASTKAFIYAPCATVGINGGSSRAMCEKASIDLATQQLVGNGKPFQFNKGKVQANAANTICYDGDFDGAIWAKRWNASNSTQAEITVPADIEDQLTSFFGQDYLPTRTDFVGIGVPSWASYQEL